MTIYAILNSISQQRFSTYQTAVFKGATDEECLGIYLWNKQLASAFLPALQILEVSLRNAIYQAKIEYEEEVIEKNSLHMHGQQKRLQLTEAGLLPS